MSEKNLGSDSGMAEASDAFKATLDAEQPSRSRSRKEKKEESPPIPMEELFPRRGMDRREPEGGEREGDPAIVKQARAQARQQAKAEGRGDPDFGEEEDAPPPRRRAPKEGNDAEPDEDELLPEDEDGDDVEPDQEEDDSEDEDEDGERGELDLDQIVEVNVDGQPMEVSLKEALRGYIRQETFHQRLGELQQGVQALSTQRNEMATYQEAFVERAQELEAYVAAFMPQEPNWEALYAEDPVNAARQERRWRTFATQVQNLVAQREATQQELEVQRNRNIHNFASANRAKLAQAHPEWSNEKAWRRDHDSMRRTARAHGYSDEEINQLYDARGVEILLKAAKYDRMMATKPRPVRGPGATPLKRNGATPSRNASRSFERAERRLSRTGSLEAAAGVFEQILDRER